MQDTKTFFQHIRFDMLDVLRDVCWQNYSLFLRDGGLVFDCFETDEGEEAEESKTAATQVNGNATE